jgi:hypothetical protein
VALAPAAISASHHLYLIPADEVVKSSTGSTSSSSSCGDTDTAGLYFGICASNKELCSKDVLIACEALELLITCLEVRGTKELAAFFSFPYVKGKSRLTNVLFHPQNLIYSISFQQISS